jgi:hypothetical protein
MSPLVFSAKDVFEKSEIVKDKLSAVSSIGMCGCAGANISNAESV